MDAHGARGRTREGVGDQAGGLVVGVDVAFEEKLLARRIDRLEKRRKVLLTVFQQRQAVAADVVH